MAGFTPQSLTLQDLSQHHLALCLAEKWRTDGFDKVETSEYKELILFLKKTNLLKWKSSEMERLNIQ